jgi:hypothetical protein
MAASIFPLLRVGNKYKKISYVTGSSTFEKCDGFKK